MIYQCNDHLEAEQRRARQVGESLRAHPQQHQVFDDAPRAGAAIDQQVAQVRWLMQREPMLEREMRPEN